MVTTHRRDGRETLTADLQGGNRCQHTFAGGNPHYCTYIHAPEVVAALRPASTPDEQLVISYLASSVLWWYLQERELAAVARALAALQPLAPAQEQLLCKRLDRCITITKTMQEASALVIRYLVAPAPLIAVGFRVEGELTSSFPLRSLAEVTARLQTVVRKLQSAGPTREPVTSAFPASLRRRLREFSELATQGQQRVTSLLAVLNDRTKPSVTLDRLLPTELLSWSAQTLVRHHPQAVDNDDTDPLVFIVAHQIFEVWFPATISALEAATTALMQEPARVVEATQLIERSADLIHLWSSMIHLPQTMSVADYIDTLRPQLEGGSGAESEQFRQVELLAGLRDNTYRQTLESMQLVTPRLETLWQQSSLNETILGLLATRGILALDALPEQQARQLAAIWKPAGTEHPHADLAALCQAALHLDEALWLWRQHHLAMVRAVLGGKPSIGAGGVQNHERLARDPQAEAVGGLPYLEQATRHRLFPLISLALEYLQENWQTVATATRRA